MKYFKKMVLSIQLLITISTVPIIAIAAPNDCSNYYPTSITANSLLPADTNSLKLALFDFIAKADSGKYNEVIAYYDDDFVSIRVIDAGAFVKMDYAQMVGFWKTIAARMSSMTGATQKMLVAQKTTLHNTEIIGDTGYTILTRIKDLGNGPEPMFYNLIWIFRDNKWRLLREIVHQRTAPNFH